MLIQLFAGDAVKGAYLGSLRLWTLMVALLMEAVMGMLSDRSTLRRRRRRPYIFTGTVQAYPCNLPNPSFIPRRAA